MSNSKNIFVDRFASWRCIFLRRGTTLSVELKSSHSVSANDSIYEQERLFVCLFAAFWCTILRETRIDWNGLRYTFDTCRFGRFFLFFHFSGLYQGTIHSCHIIQETFKSLPRPRFIACVILKFFLKIEAIRIWTADLTHTLVEKVVGLVQK